MGPKMFLFFVLVIMLSVSNSVAEEFAYYKLAVQWPNAICNLGIPCSKTAAQIRTDYQRFTIHGLWPFWANNSMVDPRRGDELKKGEDNPKCAEKKWPNLVGIDDFAFWKYEWANHGTCSGLEPSAYFALALELRRSCGDDFLGLKRIGFGPRPAPYRLIDFYKKMKSALGSHAQLKCNVRNGGYQLAEVYICIDRQKALFHCPYRFSQCGNNEQALLLFPDENTVHQARINETTGTNAATLTTG